MEDHIHEKLKFKLKLSKPLDHHHHHQEHKLVHHPKQEQASFQLNHHHDDHHQEGVLDDDEEFEEGEIREDEVRDQEQEHEQEQEPENYQKKFCPHCGKEFKNGKALGGHLRIHADNSGKSEPKVKETGSSPNPGKTVVCNICGKRFPSEKSLYGHMRSHPNRGYRGMNPPGGSNPHGLDPPDSNQGAGSNPPTDHDSGSNSDDLSSGQLEVPILEKEFEGLIGWTVKGRRGQSLGSPVDPSEVSSSSMSYGRLAEVAAGELMVLASGEEGEKKVEVRSNCSTLKEKNNNNDDELKIKLMKKLDEYDDDELYYLQDVLGISYNSTTSSTISANTPLNNNTSNFDFYHPNKTLASFVTSQKVIKSGGDKIVSKKRKIIKDWESLEVVANHHYDADDNNNDNHNDDVRKREFKCTTCGKTFVTHQALGGHRSSHNKERPNHHSKSLNPNSAQAQAQAQTRIDNGPFGSTQLEHGEEIMMGGIVHKCKICNQGFPSGQALGGHQRCHYSGQSTDSSPDQSSSQTGRQGMIHGLDLNVIMQEENCEDEGEVDVESTYNS